MGARPKRYGYCAMCGHGYQATIRKDGTTLKYCPQCRDLAGEQTTEYGQNNILRIVADPEQSWSPQTHLTRGEVEKLAADGNIAPGTTWKDVNSGATFKVGDLRLVEG